MLLLLFIPFLFGLDFMIKNFIERQEDSTFPTPFLNGKITLHKSHNRGMIMGFLSRYPKAVKLIPACVTVLISLFYLPFYFKKGNYLIKFSGVLTITGALNNLYDRLSRGYVVDYFSLPIKRIKHIIFNLSDMFIFLGTLLMVIWTFLKKD